MRGRAAAAVAIMAVAAIDACARSRAGEGAPPPGVQQSIEIRLLVPPEITLQLGHGAARDVGLVSGQMTVTGTSTGSPQRAEVVIGPYRVRRIRDAEITLRAIIVPALGAGESSRVTVSGTERVLDPRDSTKTRTRPILRIESEDATTWDEVERWAAAIRVRRPR